MTHPQVSVIMSVFNEEQYLRESIASILSQTFHNFEFIIINDYSTDRSLQIIEESSKKDSRIRFYAKTTEPRYLAASRNIGVSMARGDYIIFQDADDVSHEERIEKQLFYALENPGKRIVGCLVNRIEDNRTHIMQLPENHEDIVKGFSRIYNRTTIVSGTILGPKQIFQDIPYRIKFRYMQDWDHMLRMYESGRVEFYNCQYPLYNYFIRKKGVLFKPEWLDFNLYIRHCQLSRKRGLSEFDSVEDFIGFLNNHPIAKIKWNTLKKMILLNLKLRQMAKCSVDKNNLLLSSRNLTK